MSDKISIETPLTIEDLTATTDESFQRIIIPYVKEWIEDKLCWMRRDAKQTRKNLPSK